MESKISAGPSAPNLAQFKITPALPTMWSNHDVPADMVCERPQSELDAIYEKAISSELRMPTSKIGTAVVPALTLGGPPFLFGMAFRSNRPLFGCIPPMAFLPLNLVVLPLGAVGACAATLPVAYGWAVGLAGGFAWITLAGGVAVYEQTRYSTQVMRHALDRNINHIETARHYLTSESFIRPVVKNVGREKLVIQTKVRPYEAGKGFVDTVEACCKTLGVQSIDLLALHGVNVHRFVPEAKVCADLIQSHPQVKNLGFSFHCATDDAIDLINSGKFSYVNMHFNYFGSYTCLNNERAVAAAAAKGMGVLCISPNGQSGHLYKPSPELAELCKPLSPMEFNMLFQLTYPGISSTSIGPGQLDHFDMSTRVVKLLPVAKDLLPTIVHRLRQQAKEKLGERFLIGAAPALEHATQGEGDWDGDPIALSLLVMAASLNRAFGLKSFGKSMHTNVSWPGDWCAGVNAAAVKGREDEVKRNFKGEIWGEEEREKCIDLLLSYCNDFGVQAKAGGGGGIGAWVMGGLMRYTMWWMSYSAGLFGFKQTKEFGSMPKTAN